MLWEQQKSLDTVRNTPVRRVRRTNAVIRLSRITYGHGTREGKIVGRGRFTDFREDAGRWLLFGGSLALPFPRPFDATLFFSTH
jgi:hypothetical protein